jgi:hypothetical protein
LTDLHEAAESNFLEGTYELVFAFLGPSKAINTEREAKAANPQLLPPLLFQDENTEPEGWWASAHSATGRVHVYSPQ